MLSMYEYMFLYIDPLKQGLKRDNFNQNWAKPVRFLYIDPLKQGLKLKYGSIFIAIVICFYT